MHSISFTVVARICATALVLGGTFNCVGHLLDVDWLINPIPGDIYLSPMAATTYMLIGLFLLRLQHTNLVKTIELKIFAVGLMTLSLTTPLFISEASYSFFILGCAFFCLSSSSNRIKGWAHGFIVLAISLALASIVSYTYGLDELKFLRLSAGFHVENAVMTLFAATGLLCLSPEHGILRLLVSATTAGKMARRLLPFVIVVPFLGLINAPERQDPRDLLLVITIVLCGLPVLILTVGSYLEKAELQRELLYLDVQTLSERLNRQLLSLQESGEKLEEALLIRNQLIAKINHELRTPLNGILGATQLLLARELSSPDLDLIGVADRSAKHLLVIVSDMLTLSDIEKDRLVVTHQTFDLQKLVTSCVESMQWLAAKKNVKLVLTLPKALPESVISDRALIENVIRKLIDNAIEFTERGEVVVRASIEYSERRPYFRFLIKDTGRGMTSEQVEQPFEASDSSFNRPRGGVGLGLVLVQKITELLNGKFQIESALGKGTLINVTLPLIVETTVSDSVGTKNLQRRSEDIIGGERSAKRILIAEDNAVNAKLLQLLLKKLNFESTVVGDGHQAVLAAAAGAYDLILMDVQMPNMDGLEATTEIRKLSSDLNNVPIIAVTAHATVEDRRKCMNSGMTDFLTKPVPLEVLKEALSKWLIPVESLPPQRPQTSAQINTEPLRWLKAEA